MEVSPATVLSACEMARPKITEGLSGTIRGLFELLSDPIWALPRRLMASVHPSRMLTFTLIPDQLGNIGLVVEAADGSVASVSA
jgi:hypothetical protein